METQINLNLSEDVLKAAKKYAELHGYDNLENFIKEVLKEKLFEKEDKLSGLNTYLASEKVLAKTWLTEEENKAWSHLQKET